MTIILSTEKAPAWPFDLRTCPRGLSYFTLLAFIQSQTQMTLVMGVLPRVALRDESIRDCLRNQFPILLGICS
ncbi:hypothetical protein A0H81_05234 [Grifola frondosa]|uniref:Uncharacterized protein n=1 Tax=Grifola frondosa TaxID=5627 RepID=A0A1C7MDD8_GRIFR|nr:hypothetical protein A0H81_05234 [Grifola frondosa]